MSFIKKNELLPQRPIIMVLYGTPGYSNMQPTLCPLFTSPEFYTK